MVPNAALHHFASCVAPRYGHATGRATSVGQSGEEHPGVGAPQNSFPTRKKTFLLTPRPQAVHFISESTIKVPPWKHTCVCVAPQRSLVCCAKKAGLLLFQFPGHLELWRVGESDGHGETHDTRTLNPQDGMLQK